jgi:predicted DNA-binding ribbon-helix-helix protein
MQAPLDNQSNVPVNTGLGDAIADPSEMRKRSVVIAGHRTSVSLENAFWEALKREASARNQTVNQIITNIDKQRNGNLSSAIRLFILRCFQDAAGSTPSN